MPDLAALAQSIANAYVRPPTGRPAGIGHADTVQQLLEAMEAGNYLETACDLAQVAKPTVYDWIRRGELGEEPFKAFSAAMKRASARAEAAEVANVRSAGKDPRFWAASMTYLERRSPEKWARRTDSSDQPKVVVQIGARDSDVHVSITTTNCIPPGPMDCIESSVSASVPLLVGEVE